jgi:hypothetical protein
MARKPDDTVNLRLRMPDSLRKRLASEAEQNERSLNSEIVYRLGKSLGLEGDELIKQHESAEERMKRLLEEIVQRLIAERKP